MNGLKIRLDSSEKEYILKNYKKKTYLKMSQYIGCHKSTIQKFLRRMGCERKTHKWTEEDYRYLYENYDGHNAKPLAIKFNCSVENIYTRIRFVKDKKMFV